MIFSSQSLNAPLSTNADKKLKIVKLLDSWEIATDEQMRALLERISLSEPEKSELATIITRVGAFRLPEKRAAEPLPEENLPFWESEREMLCTHDGGWLTRS